MTDKLTMTPTILTQCPCCLGYKVPTKRCSLCQGFGRIDEIGRRRWEMLKKIQTLPQSTGDDLGF